MTRTHEEVLRQIDGLKNERKKLPEFSLFGNNNWAAIDAQLDVLEGLKGSDDIDEDMDDYDEVLAAALEAEEWMDGSRSDDLFDED